MAELLRDAQHSAVLCPSAHASATEELKMSYLEKNLVNTELGQEVPKGTSRNMMLHPKKFQHFIDVLDELHTFQIFSLIKFPLGHL